MRIEETTDKERLSKASDKELLVLKLRFTQQWDKNFEKNAAAVVGSLNRSGFLKNYRLLLNEMNSRELETSTSPVDRAAFKKAMVIHKFGVDTSDLDDVVVVPNCIIVDASEIDAEEVADLVKSQQEDIWKSVLGNGHNPTALAESAYISLYDLVLKAKQETAIVEITKPYPNEHSARLQDPDKFVSETFRRTKGGTIYGKKEVPATIGIIWAKLKGSAKPSDNPIPQALRFPVKTWTAVKAKRWLSDNNVTYTGFEAATKVKKALEEEEPVRFIPVFPIDKASEEHIVCGIVYEPDAVDAQNDKANEVEIRKAAYQFMEKVQSFRVQHEGKKVRVKVLESYLAPVDFTIAKKKIKKGTWLLTVRVLDKKIWKAVKDGELTGFSMAGQAESY